ncbi:phosphoglycerate mutase-like protein [Cubamyces lactineus]|nr:phosphoglycerate mutase-like protein [Cubamyces lactineus]
MIILPSSVSLLVATVQLAARCYGRFNPLHHSGAASPYFDAPAQFGIPSSTPPQCFVDRAAYIVRHGSRFPEPGSFAGWQALYEKFQNSSYVARGPLAFIPFWTPPVDDILHQPLYLSSTGARESFDLGVELRKRYGFTSGGDNLTVWTAGQQRVVDTATYFLQGYLSQGNYLSNSAENRGIVIAMPDSVNYTFADSLTPSSGCPAYSTGDTSAKASIFRATYQGKIASRLNRFLDGLELADSDVGVMQDLCGFQAEINGDTRFCDVFTESEWKDYEYAHDLNYYYGSGPGNPFSATVGYPWLHAVTDLFVSSPNRTEARQDFVPPALIMSFTHDNNLPPVVSALGVWNSSSAHGVYPLSVEAPNPGRTFRSSYLVSFRGYVALERLSCRSDATSTSVKHGARQSLESQAAHTSARVQKFVRIRINNAVVPVPHCDTGPGFSCPLGAFVAHTRRRAVVAGDFVDRCGLKGVKNATGVLDIFTQVPSRIGQTYTLLMPQPYAISLP